MATTHTIPVEGGEMSAYCAMPAILPAPAIIVIQEIFGVNQEIRDRCDAYAQNEGFIAIAPDMFHRIEPNVDLTDQTQEEWDKAFALMNKFDPEQGTRDLQVALDYTRELEACTGKVGNIGFCLGGKLSYMMASRTDVDASAAYYGVGLQDMLDEMQNIKAPTLIHIAVLDKFTPQEAQEQIINEAKEHELVTTYLYEGCDHAFARKGGEHYDKEAADLAYQRSFELFNTVLKV